MADYYVDGPRNNYLLHKSCILLGCSFTNDNYTFMEHKNNIPKYIRKLKLKMKIVEQIENTTNFYNEHNKKIYKIRIDGHIYVSGKLIDKFRSFRKFIVYVTTYMPELIKLPDKFYILKAFINYIADKSCIYDGNTFSNKKLIRLDCHIRIKTLQIKCDIYDKIEEKTHFVNGKFNDLEITVVDDVNLYIKNLFVKSFENVDNFIDYITKEYLECIKNNDIKIALKD
jgi:hypothetical protein